MKKTIFIPFFNLGLGGVQTKIIDLANTLASQNYRVIVYLRDHGAFDKRNLLSNNVLCIQCPSRWGRIFRRRYNYIFFLLLLWFRPHSFYVSLEELSLFVIDIIQRIPFYNPTVVLNVDTFVKFDQLTSTLMLRDRFQRASYVVAPSRDTFVDLKKRLKLKSPPLVYIPNWTDSKKSTQKNIRQGAVFAGRFASQKRPLLYLKMMNILRKRFINLRLSMYGEGPMYDQVQFAIQKHQLSSYVSLHKPVMNLPRVLADKKYLFLFSRYEGLPIIALEAMRSGCIIVSLDTPGTRDAVIDGKTGICKKTLIQAANALRVLETNPAKYKTMQRNAYRHVDRIFSTHNRDQIVQLLIA